MCFVCITKGSHTVYDAHFNIPMQKQIINEFIQWMPIRFHEYKDIQIWWGVSRSRSNNSKTSKEGQKDLLKKAEVYNQSGCRNRWNFCTQNPMRVENKMMSKKNVTSILHHLELFLGYQYILNSCISRVRVRYL